MISLGLGFVSGSANQKHKTDLTDRIEITDKESLNEVDAGSFKDGIYNTYITLDNLLFYRVFGLSSSGHGARIIGRFVTTEYAESMIDVKIRLALDIRWRNTKFYEAAILVPQGVIINVGVVAPITLISGTVLEGGADQIMLPFNWSDTWIQGYRKVTQKPQMEYPVYYKEKPDASARNHNYP
ncbi:MAG: hypothetical protein FWD48_03875 [Oscillospiraceae bacterium]|nr:hypothetical protein [Oscillospiraceae bacterium]